MSRGKCSIFRRSFLASIYFLLTAFAAEAQFSSLSGVILDEQTGKPVPYGTVFLASTTLGASADENGNYKIEKIPIGKYDVVVSSVGYDNNGFSIEFTGANLRYNFLLKQKVVSLQEVVVDGSTNRAHYATFLKYFLGTTPNASACKIENPEHLYFNYDEKKKVLKAEADAPLVILNHALGYKIHYILDEFMYDDSAKTIRVFGIPRFENLQPENDRQERRWTRARDEAYLGSVKHLMRSLFQQDVIGNRFFLQRPGATSSVDVKEFFKVRTPDSLFFQGPLQVVYEDREHASYRKNANPAFRQPQPVQTTVITFTAPALRLYRNGYYEDPKSLQLDGYMAWSESVSELVPLGYEPSKK